MIELQSASALAQRSVRRCAALPLDIASFTLFDLDYPALLAEIYDPPLAFFVRDGGRPRPELRRRFLSALDHAVAAVGTRNPAPFLDAALAAWIKAPTAGCVALVSGFARGVDRLAHLAAIAAGRANVAVLGAGILNPGPQSNLDLPKTADAAELDFFFVSEFLPDDRAFAGNFPRRNRIIAGLVEQLNVFQAPHGSGALISARFALEEGRTVQVFDHQAFDLFPGSNDGGRAWLADGAAPILLPARLELHTIPSSAEDPLAPRSPQQLQFWRERRHGISLGARHFLRWQ